MIGPNKDLGDEINSDVDTSDVDPLDLEILAITSDKYKRRHDVESGEATQPLKIARQAEHEEDSLDLEVQHFKKLVEAARNGDEGLVRSLLHQNIIEKEKSYKALVRGAAHGGHEQLVEQYKQYIMAGGQYMPADNWAMIVANYAALGGHKALAERYFNKKLNKSEPDYASMVVFAARGEQQELTEYFINIMPGKNEKSYFWAICGAAQNGNDQSVEHYSNKITDKNLIDYNLLAQTAAAWGHQALAEGFLNKISDENKRNYLQVAACAAQNGRHDIAECFLNKITDKNKIDYNFLAAYAAENGYGQSAQHFLNQITDESKRKYNSVAIRAAKGGFGRLAKCFFNKISDESKRDYKSAALQAAYAGYQGLADCFSEKLGKDNFVLFNSLAFHAAWGGHPNMVNHYFDKIPDEKKREYISSATGFVRSAGQYQYLAETYFDKIYLKNKVFYIKWPVHIKGFSTQNVGYFQKAGFSASCGYQELTEYFLKKCSVKEMELYNVIISCADQGKHPKLATYLKQLAINLTNEAKLQSPELPTPVNTIVDNRSANLTPAFRHSVTESRSPQPNASSASQSQSLGLTTPFNRIGSSSSANMVLSSYSSSSSTHTIPNPAPSKDAEYYLRMFELKDEECQLLKELNTINLKIALNKNKQESLTLERSKNTESVSNRR